MALAGLLCLWPAFLVIVVLIKLDSAGPAFFTQERVGRGFRPFWIYKFRTMVAKGATNGRPITCGNDPRITRIGRFLRRTKLDELPQLFNVLKGEMSIVGPRPELRQYVEYLRQDYVEVLSVRPGITDLASLKFRDEATLLGSAVDPEAFYRNQILPQKVTLAKQYIRGSSLTSDVALIIKTLSMLARGSMERRS